MLKTITLLKRRPGLSVADFRDYYESKHVLLGVKYTQPEALRYTRRYLTTAEGAGAGEPRFDVAMELWFADRESLDRVLERLQQPDIAAEIAADEEALFDRQQTHFMVIDEEIESLNTSP
ncbi:MAG: EthD domain-containing protein [Chromatocurvus sp.]